MSDTANTLKTEASSLMNSSVSKVAKPTSNAIVWSIITAVFLVAVLIITGTAVAIQKSSEESAHTPIPSDRVYFDDGTFMVLDTIVCHDPTVTCHGHGTCEDHYGCRCDSGYTTHKAENGTMCNYKQKSQMTAFLLTLFLGEFGAGRFYVGQTVTAVIKLLLIVCGCCLTCVCSLCVAPCLGLESGMTTSTSLGDHFDSDKGALGMVFAIFCGTVPFICSSCALSIWCIVDIILFATNSVPDANGVYPSPM